MKAALYIRVSTAEQAMHGYSLAAQEELLRDFAQQKGYTVAGLYADEGKSANKALNKRTELIKMVSDAEAGKFNLILFKDITRWSRNSSDYYKIQDRLDACNCAWIAVQQPYLETQTPTGRFQVSIMLGTAQLESEQTSERIRFTAASRIKEGGVLYGSERCPIGYCIGMKDGKKRMIIDDSMKDAAKGMFDHFEQSHSIQETCRWLFATYGIRKYETSVRNALRNPIYIGKYHDIEGYTDPLISEDQFNRINVFLQRRSYTTVKTHKYIFSSLINCGECGHRMTGCHNQRPWCAKDYLYYQCKQYKDYKTASQCDHKKTINQDVIENYLLDRLEPLLQEYIQQIKLSFHDSGSKKKKAALQAKANRIKELYIEGDLSKEDYSSRIRLIEKQISDIQEPETKDLSVYANILNSDWKTVYSSLDNANKCRFWRSIIKEIRVYKDNRIEVYFL